MNGETKHGSKLLEYLLVTIQFAGILLIGMTTKWASLPLLAVIAGASGFTLGGYAILVMKIGNFHVLPSPVKSSEMVLHGPYRYIRHPMYTSVLLTLLALVAGDYSQGRLITWLLLVADLIVKLEYEEKLLMLRFPAYRYYRQKTKRLIPFLF
jgi:protein-S-isoprenylcysteine O-methyltransferase Ste14